jgi:hypothetical protein
VGTVTGVAQNGAPVAPSRAYAAPNPFARATSIHFTLTRSSRATINIYDVRGALVRQMVTAPLTTGAHSIEWDGTDSRGHSVSTGLYFWRVHADDSYRLGGPGENYSGRMVRVN